MSTESNNTDHNAVDWCLLTSVRSKEKRFDQLDQAYWSINALRCIECSHVQINRFIKRGGERCNSQLTSTVQKGRLLTIPFLFCSNTTPESSAVVKFVNIKKQTIANVEKLSLCLFSQRSLLFQVASNINIKKCKLDLGLCFAYFECKCIHKYIFGRCICIEFEILISKKRDLLTNHSVFN